MDESILQSLVRLVRESPVGMGARSTMDAFQQDVGDIADFRLPRQAMRTANDVFSAYQNPAFGTYIPNIPRTVTLRGLGMPKGAGYGHYKDEADWLADLAANKVDPDLPRIAGYDSATNVLLNSTGRLGEFIQQLQRYGSQAGKWPDDMIVKAAKTFNPPKGMSNRGARLAKPGATPQTPYEKMLAAVIDENTGEALYQMRPYRAGDHGGLMTVAESIPNWRPIRGFVDPQTFDAFTEAMLEEALMRQKGFIR